LESAGFLKKKDGNFVVNKVVLANKVKIGKSLIPQYFFYSLFGVAALAIELLFYEPVIGSCKYCFLFQ